MRWGDVMDTALITSTMWGGNLMIPLYLYFGGITAGLGIVAVVADLLEDRNPAYNLLSKWSAYLAVPAWALGSVFVIFHLGKPMRGMFFPLFFSNYGSWMTYGGWAMGLAGPILIVYLLLRHFDMQASLRRLIGVINIPVMLWVALNTAMLLSAASRVPMWDRAFLPALFINSGILSGLAAAGLVFIVLRHFGSAAGSGEPARVIYAASVVALVLEVIEAGILYGLINNMATGGPMDEVAKVLNPAGAMAVYNEVVSGSLAPWFWWGVVAIGIVVPLTLGIVELVAKRWEEALAGAKFACILIGALVLRFVVVWGGDFRPLPAVAVDTLRDLVTLFAG